MRQAFLIGALVCLVALAGCGGSESETATSATTGTSTATPSPTATSTSMAETTTSSAGTSTATSTVTSTTTATSTSTTATATDTQSSSGSGLQVRIMYDGEWSAAVGGDGGSRTVDGSGTETIDVDDGSSVVSANAQKQDDGNGELTIQILSDGEVIKQSSTTAAFGVASVSAIPSQDQPVTSTPASTETQSQSDGSGLQIRVLYDGEWSGAISAGGSSRTVEGSGDETIDIPDDASIVSANAQKMEANNEELTIQILRDGEVIQESSTTAEYGVASVSANT